MKHPFAVPFAIVLAGFLIGGTIYISQQGSSQSPDGNPKSATGQTGETLVPPEVFTLKPDDHIIGNPSAPIRIIEYSDFECPFCKRFHFSMLEIMDEYGKTGEVAWVYRHFPIDSIHPKARKEAEASECATEIGGPDAFWKYMNRVIEITPSNNGLDPKELPEVARHIGIDVDAFNECLESGRHAGRVERDFVEGVEAGIGATPYSFAIQRDGRMQKIAGAHPYQNMKVMIDGLLRAQPGSENIQE